MVVVGLGAVFLVGCLLAARSRVRVIVVRGHSMMPTLEDGERVLLRVGRSPRRGAIVAFADPFAEDPERPDLLVKRVAAVAGDLVEDQFPGSDGSATVPAGFLLVQGDSVRSRDSRQFGFLPVAAVVGVVVRRLALRPVPEEVG